MIASSTVLLTASILTATFLPSNQEAPSLHSHQYPKPTGPIQQMTATLSAILINHHPDSINEPGVTSTLCYPNRQDCRSRRLFHPLSCSPPPSLQQIFSHPIRRIHLSTDVNIQRL
ncbi:hypothetical protein TNCV_1516731 [Trichonephila clavipes]|nr:hypothetical protein TNCV_1516731 [Trichonephila clavipes]